MSLPRKTYPVGEVVKSHKKELVMALTLALSSIGLIGCSETVNSSNSVSKTTSNNRQTSDSGEMPYPRMVATHIHATDGEITEEGSPVAPSLVEKQFLGVDWTKPASLGVHIDANTSLTIKNLPAENDVERIMVAVWRRKEKEINDISVCVVRFSEPLKNKEQALALLQSFVKDQESVASSIKWKVKSRGSAIY